MVGQKPRQASRIPVCFGSQLLGIYLASTQRHTHLYKRPKEQLPSLLRIYPDQLLKMALITQIA